jgi:hypothetical protein
VKLAGLALVVVLLVALELVLARSDRHRAFAPAPAPSCRWRDGGALPDPVCTPGVLNPAVTQATIRSTICARGWTATIRPSVSWTGPRKLASMRAYGVAGPSGYEYDHLVSLELGGAPADTLNLWPEPHAAPAGQGSFAKDKVENRLRAEICSGRVTLAAAQQAIRTDWRLAP